MKMCYILRADGSSLFQQPYSEDFCYHCLSCLLNRSDEQFYLSWIDVGGKLVGVQPISAHAALERISLCEPVEQKNILTYILK